jgi:hypothetical protein
MNKRLLSAAGVAGYLAALAVGFGGCEYPYTANPAKDGGQDDYREALNNSGETARVPVLEQP